MDYFTKTRKLHCYLFVVGHRSSPKPSELYKDLYDAWCLETGTVVSMYGRELTKQRLEREVDLTVIGINSVNHDLLRFGVNVRRAKYLPAPWYVWLHYGLTWAAMKLLFGKASRDFVWEITG